MNDVDTFLERIDEATTEQCHQCARPLGDSVSEWWCSPGCQQDWTEHQVDVQRLIGYREPWHDPEFAPVDPFPPLLPDLAVSDVNYGRAPIRAPASLGELFAGMNEFAAALERGAREFGRAFTALLDGMAPAGQARIALAGRGQVTFVEVDVAPDWSEPLRDLDIDTSPGHVDGDVVLAVAARQAAAQHVVEPNVRIADRTALTGPAPGWGPPLHADPRRNRSVR